MSKFSSVIKEFKLRVTTYKTKLKKMSIINCQETYNIKVGKSKV